MDILTQMTVFTAVGGLVGQWLLGVSCLVGVLHIYLLNFAGSNAPRVGPRRGLAGFAREALTQMGITVLLLTFDFLYFIFRDMRLVLGLTEHGDTNITVATFYLSATDWHFIGSVIAWLFKTAFSDAIMLFRASKLLRDSDRLGGQVGYYAIMSFLTLLYLGTVAAGIITWVGLLRPTASTFDEFLENSATFFMGIHCGYNILVTTLISFVYWRAMAHQFRMMTLAQLALRAFSAGNLLYTLLVVILVIFYQKQMLVVYFWYDITQPLMTMSFTVPMLLTAAVKVLSVHSSTKSSHGRDGIQAVSGIAVSVRRDQEVDEFPMGSVVHESRKHSKGLDSDDDISAGP